MLTTQADAPPDTLLGDFPDFVEVFDGCEYIAIDSSIDAAQDGHYVKSDAVAAVLIVEIGAVVHKRLTHLLQSCPNLVSVYTQQRANDMTIAWLDATQPLYARTANHIEQYALDVVVLMMGYRDAVGLERRA